ncbi:hypothetical protein [Ruminococcus bicirculans (ex Wegman et al. 2014)]|uniref:hypothetical protein n=1 Tax=Ruminococcus bicirculans (ex Wegman et al. 2014) TaxID=1160721 RepID=UPI003670C8F1
MDEKKKIICKLMVSVYSDGTYGVEKFVDNDNTEEVPADEPSSKMAQIIDTIRAIKKIYQERFANDYDLKSVISVIYAQAVKLVADHYNVSPSSVSDKLTRQCSMKKNDWIKILIPYLEKNDLTKIKSVLRYNIVKGKTADLNLIKAFLEEQGSECC